MRARVRCGDRVFAVAMGLAIAGLAQGGERLAKLDVAQAADAEGDVALFTASTVMDVPGGASVTNRLEIQCVDGQVNYIVIDFATPRMAEHTRTLDTELAQRFAHEQDQDAGAWRLHFDALEWQGEAPDEHGELRNLQLNRMVYRGDGAAWVERLAAAPYLRIEQPARGDRAFLFELSHLGDELDRLEPHCGV